MIQKPDDQTALMRGSAMRPSAGSGVGTASATSSTTAAAASVFANAVTEDYAEPGELERICDSVLEQLGTSSADLCILFAGAPRYPELPSVLSKIGARVSPAVMIGCSGSGVIGGGLEIEMGRGMTIIAANCDTSRIRPFAFEDKHANNKDASPTTLLEATGIDPAHYNGSAMLLLIDPLTVATDAALSALDSGYPHAMKFGGLVGGGMEFGENAMFIGDRLLRQGAVGLMLPASMRPEMIVSSNEVPIGDPMPIAVANRNVILRFEEAGPEGVTPLESLHRVRAQAPARTRHLLEQTLVAGIESDRTSYSNTGQFDFVMRNIMGVDENTGAMAIGDLVEEGQVFQFHVRDPELAASDLRSALIEWSSRNADASPPALALSFNSVTRGTRLFDEPNHDAQLIARYLDGSPSAGFFSNGEIVSRIGGFLEDEYVTKVMGYTHSVVVMTADSKPSSNGN